jgi:hypothetical protein
MSELVDRIERLERIALAAEDAFRVVNDVAAQLHTDQIELRVDLMTARANLARVLEPLDA